MKAFDPSKFSSRAEALELCNSEHPLMGHVESMVLKPLEKHHKDLKHIFYVFLKNDKGVYTYRDVDHTVQFHDMTKAEFKAAVATGKLESPQEIVHVGTQNKYIGNVMLEDILDRKE